MSRILIRPMPNAQRFAQLALLAPIALAMALDRPAIAHPEPAPVPRECRAQLVENPDPNQGYEFQELNNCPILTGTFSDGEWDVTLGLWEPGAYLYRHHNRRTGERMEIIDFLIFGTTERTHYSFAHEGVRHVVTFRREDPDWIRLEIFHPETHRRLLNRLLRRSRNPLS